MVYDFIEESKVESELELKKELAMRIYTYSKHFRSFDE